jgi:hypothetical protein
MLEVLSAAIALGLAAVTILGGRGARGGVSLPVLLLPLAAAGAGASVVLHWPLIGPASTGAEFLVQLALGMSIVSVIALLRRSSAPTAPSRRVFLIPVCALLGVLVVGGLWVGRGRPQPGSVPARCNSASFGVAAQPDLALVDGSIRITGVHMSWDAQTHKANGCSLSATLMSGATETIPVAPPSGFHGSDHCGTGTAYLCGDAALLLVEESQKGPLLSILDTHEFYAVPLRSPLQRATPTLAGIGSGLAPPRTFVWLAALGLLVAVVGTLLGHRVRVGEESAEQPAHPYRTPEGGPASQPSFTGSRWPTLPRTACAALVLGLPLLASLLSR